MQHRFKGICWKRCWESSQLELVLADVLRQGNALAYCFSVKAEEAVVMLVGE